MKNPNLTLSLPAGYLDSKAAGKVTAFNTRVGEFEAELRQLAIDATGDAIDPMTAEVSELEQWQHIIRRRRLELARRGLSLCEERESLVDDLLDENTKAIAKAEQGLAKATKKTIEVLQSAGIGPRPGATPNAARIQMAHKAGESKQVAAARDRLATAKTATDLLHTAARSDEQLREHYRDEIDVVVQIFAQF